MPASPRRRPSSTLFGPRNAARRIAGQAAQPPPPSPVLWWTTRQRSRRQTVFVLCLPLFRRCSLRPAHPHPLTRFPPFRPPMASPEVPGPPSERPRLSRLFLPSIFAIGSGATDGLFYVYFVESIRSMGQTAMVGLGSLAAGAAASLVLAPLAAAVSDIKLGGRKVRLVACVALPLVLAPCVRETIPSVLMCVRPATDVMRICSVSFQSLFLLACHSL